jgi:serine-type D-Ala-D-Ala carboxypeptidase/endopeptidase (penicillin-binding protein 4)
VRLALAAVLCAAVAGAPACASRLRDPLVQPSVIGARERHVRRLQADLAAILAAGVLQRGLTAVEVASLDRRDVLFRYNADRLVMPASNMKILTLAAAAERLGWDYTFETMLYPTGPVLDGTLQGDLVIRGNGDPSLNARQLLPGPVLDAWADVLAASGIRRIAGRLVGDDNAFDEESFGQGWPLDDLEEGYSAPVGALQVYEDAVTVSIAAGEAPGLPAHVALATPGSGWAIDNRAMTGAIGTDPTIAVHRARGALLVHVTGNIPAASEGITRSLAVDNPTTYLLGLLATALERRGITIGGGIADIDELPRGSVGAAGAPLVVYRSPPLREIARTMMTVSQNLYAETLLRAVGQVEGGAARAVDGKAAVLAVLNAWGVPSAALVVADGSGLSRYNYLTADAVVSILRHMHDDVRHRGPWLDALAVAGQPGTLRRRFVGTPAEGRLRAKTGVLSNVRSLSGYISSANGEKLVFAIVVNNVTAPSAEIHKVIDAAVLRLAAFDR